MRRVLIVDDHVLTRMGLAQFVSHLLAPVQFEEAESASQALGLVRPGHWELVLLDRDLPDRNGLDILTDLRQAEPRLPVLIVSGSTDEELALRAMQGGPAASSGRAPRLRNSGKP